MHLPVRTRSSRITTSPRIRSAVLPSSSIGLQAFIACLTLCLHPGCERSRRIIVGETGITRIPMYADYAALVLVCSLVVHALQVSLHQERAIVGASHGQFWSLAGGISGTLTAHDGRAVASGCVISSRGPCSGHKGHQIFASESLILERLRVESRGKVGTIDKCRWKSRVAHPVRLTYLNLLFVHILRLSGVSDTSHQ
jgi:hypothetical protein